MTSAEATAAPAGTGTAVRFYRPELDVLRFFAFLGVLVDHGPAFVRIRAVGAFGLSMFFLLSAYLITELLIREREKTTTVSWRFFFIRRALRIWPLYFGALALACLAALLYAPWWVAPKGILSMSFFVANWFFMPPSLGVLIAHLWSISIEEQFYLIWPPVMKYGGVKLARALSAGFIVFGMFWLWRFADRREKLWCDTPVEFIFFGAGSILAIVMHRRSFAMNGWRRMLLFLAGLVLLVLATRIGIGGDLFQGILGKAPYRAYASAAMGCVLVFRSTLGLERFPGFLVYWGKISYGLYVVHIPMLHLTSILLTWLRPSFSPDARAPMVNGLTLAFSLAVAHFSYQYFEKPFLKLKKRFTIVTSRPE